MTPYPETMPSQPPTERRRRPPVSTVTAYVAATLVTLTCWALIIPADDPANVPDAIAWKVNLDLAIGVLGLALLPLRHRFPFALALVLSVLLAFSSGVSGAWGYAAITLGYRRNVPRSAAVIVLAMAASVATLWWMPPDSGDETTPRWVLIIALVLGLIYTLVTSIGFYAGARQDLIRSWQERAQTAEREQTSRMAQARVAERTRIAREMHDVLAHRISTVAMHSGALAYRTDLEPEQVRDAARLIQENAHSALVELREILGVLRDESQPGSVAQRPEPPQPTISDIDALVEEAAAAGQEIHLQVDVDVADIPAGLGRHMYRAVQECLTNARKHAPDTPVGVLLTRSADHGSDDLVVEVSNPLVRSGSHARTGRGAAAGLPALHVPPSGVGLLGLAERAELAGGRLDHGPQHDRYVTRLTVPWPKRSTS